MYESDRPGITSLTQNLKLRQYGSDGVVAEQPRSKRLLYHQQQLQLPDVLNVPVAGGGRVQCIESGILPEYGCAARGTAGLGVAVRDTSKRQTTSRLTGSTTTNLNVTGPNSP